MIISVSDTTAAQDDRFHRFGLIEWWDQAKLLNARVVVIGAGALGNELIKNLALLGVGRVFVADKDRIENSNLSRSVLYRAADNGKPKATVAAAAAKAIYPDIKSHAFDGDVIHALGAGVYRWADVVLGGLDNREARLSINRHCFRVGTPWVDGAIQQIEGVARVFVPDQRRDLLDKLPEPVAEPPCYECTMSDRDWQLLKHRRSCNGLSRDEMKGGKTPTTPTISSIIAGVQCQETLKLLHGLPSLAGHGWTFVGLSADGFQTQYPRKPDCTAHDAPDSIVELDVGVRDITLRELLRRGRQHAGDGASLELGREILAQFACPACGDVEPVYASLASVPASRLACPKCSAPVRGVQTIGTIRGDEDFLDRTPADIGIPPFDIVVARSRGRAVGLEFTPDAREVLGELYEPAEHVADAGGLEWA
jgi:adenylyltransferase/sulfurtransferase